MKSLAQRIPTALLLLLFPLAVTRAPGAAATASAQKAPELTIRKIVFAASPCTVVPPTIDGDLSDSCWRDARKLEGFRLTAGKAGAVPRHATTAWVTHDATHVYVAFECIEPDTAGLKAPCRLADDPEIEFDDRVEVMFDTGHDHRNYWHLAVNAAGATFDQSVFYRLHGARTNETHPEKNLRWHARTRVAQGRWFAEIAVDVTTLGLARLDDGTTWGFNVGRARRPDVNRGDEISRWKPGPEAEYSAWAPTRDHLWETVSNFHAPLEFGDLVFGDPGFEVAEIAMRSAQYTMGGVGQPSRFGSNPLLVTLKMRDGKPRMLAALVETVSEGGATRRAGPDRVPFIQEVSRTFDYEVVRDGEARVSLSLADPDTGKVYYKTHYTDTAPPFADFELGDLYARERRPGGAVRVRLVAGGVRAGDARMRLDFRDLDGRVLQTATIDRFTTAAGARGAAETTAAAVFDLAALRALPGGDYEIACTLIDATTGDTLGTFSQRLTKPDPALPTEFEAARGAYSFGGLRGEAVRLRFPGSPAAFVFWDRACNVPWWDIDQYAASNEFIEAWGAGTQGCAEPMQDRECRYSRVELLEQSPARAVVRWRYALADARYRIHQNEWVEETYVFQPDGTGVRQVRLWANSATQHEVMELIPVKPPGMRAADMFDAPVSSLTRLADGARWPGGVGGSKQEAAAGGLPGARDRERYREFLSGGTDFIARLHLRGRPQPFTVFSMRPERLPGVTGEQISLCRDPLGAAEQRGHWPASRWALDGYNAIGRDVPTHFSLGNIHMNVDPGAPGGPTNTWLFLLGVAPDGSPLPARYAEAWLQPAELESLATEGGPAADCSAAYDPAQRAHRITLSAPRAGNTAEGNAERAETTRLVFKMPQASAAKTARTARASQDVPSETKALLNPALLVAGTDARTLHAIRIGGTPLPAKAFASGRTHTGETAVFIAAEVPFGAPVDLEWRERHRTRRSPAFSASAESSGKWSNSSFTISTVLLSSFTGSPPRRR